MPRIGRNRQHQAIRLTSALVKTRARVLPALLLALLPMSLPAADADATGADRIIVKWRAVAGDTVASKQVQVRSLAQRLGEPELSGHAIGGSLSVLRLATRQQGRQLDQTLARLRADADIEIAEPDQHVYALAYTPSDPLFTARLALGGRFYDYQWYLKSTQPAAIRADMAWDITRGGTSPATSPVVVAVVDSGVRPNHPDLAGKLLPGFDFVSCSTPGDCTVPNDGDGWDADPTDPGDFITAQDLQNAEFQGKKCGSGENFDEPAFSTWHGTRVAGLVGANTDNGIGMAGVGFNTRVVPVRVLGKCGGTLSDVLAGMYWAAGFFDNDSGRPIPYPVLTDPAALRDHPNRYPAQIINMSLGAGGRCSPLYATAIREITAVGVLIVAAAGNDGGEVSQPADCPGVLAVAGLRQSGAKVNFSSLGPEIGIAAPAGNCVLSGVTDPCLYGLSTLVNLGTQGPGADSYSTPLVQPSSGTSFAAPLVSGTAALMKSLNPALTPAQLIARLQQSARAFPTTDELLTTRICALPSQASTAQTQPCICTTQVCGAGMLDAGAAVLQALRPVALVSVYRTGGRYTLDARASAAATPGSRMLVNYAWSVAYTSEDAGTPGISGANQAVASVPIPVRGNVTLQLTITDNLGSTDTTYAMLNATSGSSASPPPDTEVQRDGGGSISVAWLALLALLLIARHTRRLTPIFRTRR
jgi:serine protease